MVSTLNPNGKPPLDLVRWVPSGNPSQRPRRHRTRWINTLPFLLAFGFLACVPTTTPGAAPPPATLAGGPGAGAVASPAPAPALAAPAPTPPPLQQLSVPMADIGMSYLPHRIAQVQGFYREAGFDVDLHVMQSSTALAGMAAGEIVFADYTGSAIRAAASGLPVRLVNCSGVRVLYSLVLGPGFRSASELEGKGVGISAIGADTHIIGRDLIRRYGGEPDRVEFLALGAGSVRYAALESGRVGGAMLALVEIAKARDANMTVVSTMDDMPLACNSGVVVTQSAMGERPQEIRSFIRAVQRAVRAMQGDRVESVSILADWAQIDPREAERIYDAANVQRSWSTDRSLGQQAIEGAIAFAKEAGQIELRIQLGDVADLSWSP